MLDSTLRARRRNPLTIQEFLGIAVQCAGALVTAHSRGIVDCDLKSENIVPTATEQVKSLDFGVPKRFAGSDKSSTAEKTRGLAGTPTYLSPEILLENHPEWRADIFSLGVVFCEALSGIHSRRAALWLLATASCGIHHLRFERATRGHFSPNVGRHRLASSLTAWFVGATLQLLRFGHPESLL
jgi:serine/threonine protein kinase